MKTLPSIHATTYRTDLLREQEFYMQDNMFFVDEEYVILPYLRAKSVLYLPFDVYRYQVNGLHSPHTDDLVICQYYICPTCVQLHYQKKKCLRIYQKI